MFFIVLSLVHRSRSLKCTFFETIASNQNNISLDLSTGLAPTNVYVYVIVDISIIPTPTPSISL